MVDYHRTLIVGFVLAASRSDSQTLADDPVDLDVHRSFADELTKILYTQDNEFSSSLGVSMALSLIYPGSTGDAVNQISDTLGYSEDNMQLVWNETTQRMLINSGGQCVGEEWDGVCDSAAPLLQIANSVWFDINNTLNADYADVVGSYAKQINFTADDSPVIVNEWVKNSTNGMIDSIVPEDEPLFPPYVLIAINSIYLKARWQEQFSESKTNLDSFYSSVPDVSASGTSEASEAHFMNMVDYFKYSHEALPGYQVIDLPFAESKMSMIFVLPMSGDSEAVLSADLLSILDDDELESTRVALSVPKFKFESEYDEILKEADDLQPTRVALSVPKFKFESEYDEILKEALIETGIEDPFMEGTGALCGIFEDEDLSCKLVIDKFIQKTVIDVNEEGVEAAAVTAAMAMPTSLGPDDPNVPILMILDHPFQFFIYDHDEELVLFEGRLGAPELPESGVALLDSKHSDIDFWSKAFYVDPVCPEDRCLDPDGRCAGEVQCLINPCDATTACGEGEVCTANYCGGCHPVCEPAQPSSTPTPQPSAAPGSSTTTPTLEIAVINTTEHQKFADELTEILYTEDNEFSSALGVSMALSLIYPGLSTVDAIEEVRDALRYPTGSNMQLVWEETTQRMLSNSEGGCAWGGVLGDCNSAAPLLQIANSVWFDDDDTLNAEYAKVVGDYAMQTDFEAVESPVIINEWVKNSTNGMIDSIVPEGKPLFPPYVLIAINSIYLKASWQEQFQESKTNLDSFYTSSSRTAQASEAHFMNMVETFNYSHEALSGYQVIDLPFAESQMSMIFVLPMSDDSEAVLSTDIISALDDLQPTRMALSVPKFKFESEYDDTLKEGLKQLGIEAPFTEGSGALCGLFEDVSECEKLVIDKIIQKTVIDVNEKGVEAAAVTSAMVGVTSIPSDDPILMILDHPLQFFIYDKEEDLMLFEGRLGAPEVPETDPDVPLLDAKHSDSDFWSNAFFVNPVDPLLGTTTTEPTDTSGSSTTQTTEASGSSTTQTAEASGSSTSQTTVASGSSTAEPTEASVLSTTQTTVASGSTTTLTTEETGSNTTQPTDASVLSTTQTTEASGSNATQPTDASVSSTTQTTEASGSNTTQPTEAFVSSTTQPTEEPDPDGLTSSGNISNRKLSSLCSCIFLAFALVFV
eukprot:CAMPEP_0201902378 /NCGR_PEP_ID=MMETSP0902-20130614/54921_1 /ASSEMBLY_ACC=CAM_ASM_000551 /TAXON_ID=420261 /ORGANISM="Thalassiosira antarctica, Strain CCMP982" /LENGTH=1151 /DNA_ID=CAMNT_0048436377 /DNA_START=102 /DNA_END=3557 /DNA_ORIENTATION=-